MDEEDWKKKCGKVIAQKINNYTVFAKDNKKVL